MRRLAMLALAALAACEPGASDVTARAPAATADAHHFTTDSAGYTLRRDGDMLAIAIGYVFRNPLQDTVSVVNCNDHVVMDLQKRVGSGWESVWHGMTNACLSAPLEVPPGDSLHGRMDIQGAGPDHRSLPTFTTTELDGEFRLIWHQPRVHYDADIAEFGDTLALSDRVSTPFRLSLPR